MWALAIGGGHDVVRQALGISRIATAHQGCWRGCGSPGVKGAAAAFFLFATMTTTARHLCWFLWVAVHEGGYGFIELLEESTYVAAVDQSVVYLDGEGHTSLGAFFDELSPADARHAVMGVVAHGVLDRGWRRWVVHLAKELEVFFAMGIGELDSTHEYRY